MLSPHFSICVCAVLALLGTPQARANSEVPLETVRFDLTYNTIFGQSVFVLGNIPELGGSDVRKSIKLVPIEMTPNGLLWRIDLAIPQGTSFTYRYVLRNDAVAAYRDSTNGTFLTAAASDSTQLPAPALRDRIVYSVIGDGAINVTFQNLPASLTRELIPVPGFANLKAAATYQRPNGPGLDFQIFANTFDTPRHAVVYRSGSLFDYVPAANATTGTIAEFALATTLIPATRTVNGVTGRGIRVYLPRGYAQNTDRCYPVLYMHDGQNVFLPGGPFGCWRAEEIANDLIRRGRIRELLIVAIDNSSNRLAEYNPEWSGGAVANHNYNLFLVNELKPYIDANYRTMPERENTGLMGSSFGGVATFSAALEMPGIFGRLCAMSTSFGYTTLDDRLAEGDLPLIDRVYLDAGDTGDGGQETVSVRDALLETGRVLNNHLYFQLGFNQQHNEAAWNARLPFALEALFPIAEITVPLGLPVPIRGDADGDGCVTLSDLTVLLGKFGDCDGSADFRSAADLNENGCIELSDLTLLLSVFGECR